TAFSAFWAVVPATSVTFAACASACLTAFLRAFFPAFAVRAMGFPFRSNPSGRADGGPWAGAGGAAPDPCGTTLTRQADAAPSGRPDRAVAPCRGLPMRHRTLARQPRANVR